MNQIIIKNTLLELVISEDVIPLIDKDRFKSIKDQIDEVTTINDQKLEHEILKAPIKVSELHNIMQNEAELLFQYKNMLRRVENVWGRYFKHQLTDIHYSKYGRQNIKLTITDAKMAIEMQPEVKLLLLSVERLSRIVKFIEDEISLMQYSYSKSIGDSIKLRIFLEGSGM